MDIAITKHIKNILGCTCLTLSAKKCAFQSLNSETLHQLRMYVYRTQHRKVLLNRWNWSAERSRILYSTSNGYKKWSKTTKIATLPVRDRCMRAMGGHQPLKRSMVCDNGEVVAFYWGTKPLNAHYRRQALFLSYRVGTRSGIRLPLPSSGSKRPHAFAGIAVNIKSFWAIRASKYMCRT